MFSGGLKQDSTFYARIFMFCECLLVYVGFLISNVVHYDDLVMNTEVLAVSLVTISLFYSVYSFAGMYKAWRGISVGHEFLNVVGCWFFIVSGSGLLVFLTKSGELISRLWFGTGVVIAFFCVCLFRFSARIILSSLRNRGRNSRSIVFIGLDNNSKSVMEHLARNKWVGLKVEAVFDDRVDDSTYPDLQSGNSILGVEHVFDYIEARRKNHTPVDQVWISINESTQLVLPDLLDKLEDTSADVLLIPNFIGLQLTNKNAIDIVANIPVLNMSAVRKDEVNSVAKKMLDFVVSFLVILIISPLLFLIAAAIKLDSSGPTLFKQKRYGIDGREISVWKFRSMVVQKESENVVQARRNDARVTRVGRFLRKTSLDELPQFFNVLKGEMSVVGPRPHAVSHNEEFRTKIRGYMGRHKIKPGITGLAQIRGWRGETDTLEKMEMRVKSDIDYIHNWSIWLDLKIIVLTIIHVFNMKNVY